MKLKIVAVLFLLQTAANAGVSPGHYPVTSLNQKRQCAVQECRLDDGGIKFKKYCESTLPPMSGWLRTLDVYSGANFSCYCPCTFDFIGALL